MNIKVLRPVLVLIAVMLVVLVALMWASVGQAQNPVEIGIIIRGAFLPMVFVP